MFLLGSIWSSIMLDPAMKECGSMRMYSFGLVFLVDVVGKDVGADEGADVVR